MTQTTEQLKFNAVLLDLIMIEEIPNQHEGQECGTGYCTETCFTRVKIQEHNEAVLYLRSLHGE